MGKRFIIGTRGSKLAIIQAKIVASLLEASGETVAIETITTTGDTIDKPLQEEGGKGLFVKEIEEALRIGEIDIAVHSMKDMPSVVSEGLSIAAVVKREDARDVFVSEKYAKFDDLPSGALIGTSSPRRSAQIVGLRPDLLISPIRGNVDTRLKKIEAGEYDATILAAAGLIRLGMKNKINEYFEVDKMVPSVGQGILGIQIREDRSDLKDLVKRACNDVKTEIALLAERSFLNAIGGNCNVPLGAYAKIDGFRIHMTAYLALSANTKGVIGKKEADVRQACDLGEQMANDLTAELEKN